MKADGQSVTAEAPISERIAYLRSRLHALSREHRSFEAMAEEDPLEAHRLCAQLNTDIDEIQELIGGLGDAFKAIDLQEVGAFLFHARKQGDENRRHGDVFCELVKDFQAIQVRVVERSRAFVTHARRLSIMHSAPSRASLSGEAGANQLTEQYAEIAQPIPIETASTLGG